MAHLAGCKYSVIDVEQSLGVTTVFNAVNVDVSKFKDYTARTGGPKAFLALRFPTFPYLKQRF